MRNLDDGEVNGHETDLTVEAQSDAALTTPQYPDDCASHGNVEVCSGIVLRQLEER